MTNGTKRTTIDAGEDTKLSLSELTEDIGAFLHFLRENTDFNASKAYQGLASFWMLIPNAIDVEWRKGVHDFKLEKEIFSRTVWIVSKPAADKDKEERKAHLLNLFSNIIARDQSKQVTTFLKFLKREDLEKIRHDYSKFKKEYKRSKTTENKKDK